MRPPKFEYYRPATIAEAIHLLSTQDNAKALAGGHSLIPAMNLRLAQPDALVDLGHLEELRGMTLTDTSLHIGALTTHAEIAASNDVQQYSHALAIAAGKIGDQQVRNWGTIGGNLAQADPAADLPTAVLALGGIIHIHGMDGARSVSADDFFIDLFFVDLQLGELIVSVELPILPNLRSTYTKYSHPASHYALVGVSVALQMDGASCQSARVAVGGSVPKATRSPSAEAALAGVLLNDAVVEAAASALLDDIGESIIGDIFAPEDYRRTVTKVYFKRAIQTIRG